MNDSGKKRMGSLFLAKLLLIGISCLVCLGTGVIAEDLQAMFAPVPQSGPAPLNVTFVDQSEGNVSIWNWDLDGVTGWDHYGQYQNYTYTTPDTYYVNLTVWNGTDPSKYDVVGTEIQVTEPAPGALIADFAVAPRIGYAPLEVSFIDQSVGAECWNWTFDENATSPDDQKSAQFSNHTYTNPGLYTVILNVSDNCSSATARTAELRQEGLIHVLSVPRPMADFTAYPRSGTKNLTVAFSDQTPGTENLSYYWDFGDETITPEAHDRNPVHTYMKNGSFDVSVIVTGTGGPTLVNKTGYISVDTPAAPLADFAASPANGTAPLSVSFIGLAEGNGHLTYVWDFGDNSTTISGRNPVHIYNATGSYNVSLSVSDGAKTGSVTRSNCVVVREPTPLAPMFTATPRNGTAPLQVSFIDQTVSEVPLTHNWYFGDNTPIVHDKNPVHVYTDPGSYDVMLQVKGGNSSDLINQSNFVTVEKPRLHKVDFAASPSEGPVPLTVSFIDQTTGDGPFTYEWDFGDDSDHSFIKNPTHVYHTLGNYVVNETVTSSAGSVSASKENLVNATTALDALPVYANFTATAKRGVAPFNIQFMDLSSGPVAAWKWTFGDGSSLTEQGPNHTYVNPGVYNVTLDVFNKTGTSNTKSFPGFITALSPTVTPKFALIYADMSNHKKIQFFDKSEGVGINYWQWNFGDGTAVSELQNPIHEFTGTGTYPIKLIVSNEYATSSTTYYIGIK